MDKPKEKSFALRLVVAISKLFQRDFITILQKYARGHVLDVGGRDYYLRVKDILECDHYTCLEIDERMLVELDDPKYECIHGDGCQMAFTDSSFDTVINIQVLEHVFEPLKMVAEISRVLKPGGYGLFVIPQTIDLHMAPDHYQNYTRYWIREAMRRNDLEIVELIASGGVFRTLASRSFLFFWHAFRVEGWHIKEASRPFMFYVLFPFMALYALLNLPICLFLSLGDLVEEANNHFVVVRKLSKKVELA